jgi:hypothetical protein
MKDENITFMTLSVPLFLQKKRPHRGGILPPQWSLATEQTTLSCI